MSNFLKDLLKNSTVLYIMHYGVSNMLSFKHVISSLRKLIFDAKRNTKLINFCFHLIVDFKKAYTGMSAKHREYN